MGDIIAGVEMNVEQIYEEHAVDGQIPEDVMESLLDDMDGDTKIEEPEVEEPELETSETEEAEEPGDDEKVILAKDGKNLIEYGKLREARDARDLAKEEAENWKQIAEENKRIAEELKATPKEEKEEAIETQLDELAEDYPEHAKQFQALSESNKTLTEKITALEGILDKTVNETAADRHFREIRTAHPDYETVVPSKELKTWIGAQPSIVQNAYNNIVEQGTSTEVNEMLSTFKKATSGETEVKPTATLTAEEIEKKVIKKKAPTSLSDIPGENVVHDEAENMLSMSPAQAEDKFRDKSQKEIEAMIAKYV
jgi:hypothetical protein